MKTRTLAATIALFMGLVAIMACSGWAAETVTAEQTKLSHDLTKMLFPKEKLIDIQLQFIHPEQREEHRKVVEKEFDYSKVESAVANTYATKFSEADLKSLLKFYKKKSAQLAMDAASKFPGQKATNTIPPNPPADTYDTRMEEANKIVMIITDKKLVTDTLKVLFADQPKEQLDFILDRIEKTYNDPSEMKKMRLNKTQDFAAVMTTPQLKEVAAFYSTPLGKKFLETNPIVGKAMKDALIQEMKRIAEKTAPEGSK